MTRSTSAALMISCTAGATVLLGPATATAEAPEQARLAACEFGTVLSNYDYTDFEAYAQRVLDNSTGEFHEKFASARPALRAQFEANEVRSRVTAIECGSVSGNRVNADILVHTTAALRNRDNDGGPEIVRTTTLVSLENHYGRWLAVGVELR
ncbi:hypothetical protein [Nocardia sp. NPDC005366]|uniref:hypothetical protein n=1 Tax=Nocardia sp. NPDC005366 TaxID=3156878 RepID=UPI0033AD9C1E